MFDTNDFATNNLLLVEQDPLQSGEIRRTLVQAGVAGRLHRVTGIIEAIAYVRRDAPYFAAPRPNFVLLGGGIRFEEADPLIKELRRNPCLREVRLLEIADDPQNCTREETGATCVGLAQLGDAISSCGSSR